MSLNDDLTHIQVIPGNPNVLGVHKERNGYNFACVVPGGQTASLLLYEAGTPNVVKEIPFPLEERVGEVASIHLERFRPKEYEYNYKIDGKIVQDPRAAAIVGRERFGKMTDPSAPHQIRCKGLCEKRAWGKEPQLQIPLSDMVMYKLHVRGFTSHRNSKVRAKGTFEGLVKKIPYLKSLGITSVELMPCYDFDENMVKEGLPYAYAYENKEASKVNFWGYTERAFYFAPKASYSATGNPVREFMEMVDSFHRAGIECIMEFYFAAGMNPLFILDILRYWKTEYHVDGFHLIGEGVSPSYVTPDPLLADTKLFFQNVEGIGENKIPYFRHLGEYNDSGCRVFRRFLKGDEDMLGEFTYHARHNPDTHGVVNYMGIQDGFTMMDMVSYDMKHNETNGENNRDGINYNYSWNCGVEGPSKKAGIKNLRRQQLRNGFLFLYLSQGIPLLYQGDEIGNSQAGNNNAYCQDNEIGWVDWNCERKNQDIRDFVIKCIAFRKKHPILHMDTEPKVMDYKSLGYPDVSYHSQRAWFAEFDNNYRHIGVMYCGKYAQDSWGVCDDFLYIAYNMHWLAHEYALPHLPGKAEWRIAIDTGQKEGFAFYEEGEQPVVKNKRMIQVPPRTIVVLVGR